MRCAGAKDRHLQNTPHLGGDRDMPFAINGRATRNFLALLVVMHFILFVDRVNLAAAAETIKEDLGLSNIALGIAFSAFNYAYAPFQLVGGWFADRFGARRTLTVCGLTWSVTTIATRAVTTIATGAVTGLAWLFAVRCVLGMGEGATLPAATRALSKWTSLEARGTAVGTDRRLPDPLVFLALFLCRARHRVGWLGGHMVVVFPRGSAPASRHHQRRIGRIAERGCRRPGRFGPGAVATPHSA